MTQEIRYQMITAKTPTELVESVNVYLNIGYKPYGSPFTFVVNYNNGSESFYVLAQAVIKE